MEGGRKRYTDRQSLVKTRETAAGIGEIKTPIGVSGHGSQIMRVGTFGGQRRVLDAAKHNMREIGGDHIDVALSHTNVIVLGPGTSHELRSTANSCIAAYVLDPKKLRKNATLMGEVIFSLPANTGVDKDAYFRAAVQWCEQTFGEGVVLSAVIHYDEASPHCHVLMLPVRGGAWLGSAVFGDRKTLAALQSDFSRDVALGFGVRRASSKITAPEKSALAKSVLDHLKHTNAPEMQGVLWPKTRDDIVRDPRPYAEILGIEAVRKRKTMAEIFTSPGCGPKKEKTPIGVALPKDHNSYALLAVPQKPPPSTAALRATPEISQETDDAEVMPAPEATGRHGAQAAHMEATWAATPVPAGHKRPARPSTGPPLHSELKAPACISRDWPCVSDLPAKPKPRPARSLYTPMPYIDGPTHQA